MEAEEAGRPVVNTIEELAEWKPFRLEWETLNVMPEEFTFKAHIKHIDVIMETRSLDCKHMKPRPLVDSDFYATDDDECAVDSDGCLVNNDGDAETDTE